MSVVNIGFYVGYAESARLGMIVFSARDLIESELKYPQCDPHPLIGKPFGVALFQNLPWWIFFGRFGSKFPGVP